MPEVVAFRNHRALAIANKENSPVSHKKRKFLKQVIKNDTEDEASIASHVAFMKSQKSLKNIDSFMVNHIMKKTFNERRKFIITMKADNTFQSIENIKNEFPLLFDTIQVRHYKLVYFMSTLAFTCCF